MSIRLMSAIFESETLGPTERLIMLSLADHADDTGRCYPSIERLCKRTGLSERAIQTNVKRLVEQGHIHIIPGGGKGKVNVYFISANPAADAPRTKCTPAADAPRTKCTPAADAPQTPQQVRQTPQQVHPNHQEPSLEPSEEPPLAPKAVSQPDEEPPPQKARLPSNWALSDKDREFAISLKLTPDEIEEIANDFHTYWTDRTDSGGRKSERGWHQAWRNRCRDVAPKFIRNRSVAGGARPGNGGSRSSLASIVARRHAGYG